MTLPIGSVDPNNLPQGVIKHDELGSALQDQSAAKFKSEAASRFPSMVNGTSAGNPANVGGPLGYVVNLSSNFTSNVANADPATIKKPDDLLPLANPFFNGLPLMDVLERIPIIGDIIEIFTGVEDGNTNDLGSWVNNFKSWLSGGSVSGTTAGWFSGLGLLGQGIIDTIFNGYHNTSETGKNLNDLSVTMANVDNRISALEGGGVRYSITSSTTIDLSGKAKVKGVLIGSSSAATAGGTDVAGTPGTPGGYVELPEIDVEWLATQVPDIAAVSVVVGTAGGETKFGQRSDGSWVFETRIGRSVKVDGFSFTPCDSGPGVGGEGSIGGSGTGGGKGGDSMLAVGGAGGVYVINGNGGAGANGAQAPIDGPAKSGGAGGGGGAGGSQNALGQGLSGGAGGHGAFPGGAPGAGGARRTNPGPGTTGGAGGSSANGYAELVAA